MIKFITVWVLTVNFVDYYERGAGASSYQLQYATQAICERQRKYHDRHETSTRCDFQQVPLLVK